MSARSLPLAPPSSLNVADHVARHARRRPASTALRFGDDEWCYGELDALSARAANALGAHGVLPGDRVALHLPNTAAFVVAYLGALRLGAVPVSVAPSWGPESAAAAMRETTPRVVVSTAALQHQLALVSTAPDLPTLLVGDSASGIAPSSATSWDAALARARDTAPISRARPDAPAAILFSSGTTAEPKGVVLSHANVSINARLKASYCGLRRDDRVALVVPLSHCYGQNAVMNAAFHAGACIVLGERFDAATLAEQVARGDVSVVFGVPQMFARVLDLGATTARSLGALRYVLSAASTMPASLAERWREETGLSMHEGYGLTESSPFAAYNHTGGHRPGTLGSAIHGVRMAVVDPESGVPCATGERGEIVLRGHNVMLGYWNRPEETARTLRGGWLHTGDMGYADEHGRFHLTDRAADLAKVAGFRVYPATVETVMRAHPAVIDVAAYGVTDAARGERLEAAVTLSSEYAVGGDDLRRHCAERLASYEVPARVHVCRELPRSATGKISRSALRAASSHPLGLQHALDARATLPI